MKTYIAFLSLLITGFGFSQQKDSLRTKNPRFIIKMTHGMSTSSEFDFTNSEWERMTPGYTVPDSLQSNLFGGTEFNPDVHTTTSNQYYMLSFSLINGASKQEGRKFLATTTFHLGYGPELRASKYWTHETSEVIDTLTSSQNGAAYYVYGNRRQTIAKTYRAQSIALGVGEHIATNPNRVFQFETGLDLLCLLSVASEVRASYSDLYTVNGLPGSLDGGYAYQPPTTMESKSESFSNKFTAGFIMRIPLEMSFKLSRKNPVLSRMRIGGELNPGFATVFSGGLITGNINVSGGMNFRFAF